jgi:opacity protein-like surface antigen
MLKKLLLACAILTATSGAALASPAPYVGASLGITDNTPNSSSSVAGSFRGAPFGVLAGYGGLLNESFYLAGELNATVATADLNNSGILKSTYGYGVSILPGVMLSDHTMAFARAGIVQSRFSTAGKNATGGQVGLGLQTSLTQNVDLRGEYDYTAYRSISNAGFSTSPRSDTATVSLIYKFE